MRVLQQIGMKRHDKDEARDAMAGISVIPGFLFGYIDKDHRCVTFHELVGNDPLHPGQREVELFFPPLPDRSKELAETLQPLAEAIFGCKNGSHKG